MSILRSRRFFQESRAASNAARCQPYGVEDLGEPGLARLQAPGHGSGGACRRADPGKDGEHAPTSLFPMLGLFPLAASFRPLNLLPQPELFGCFAGLAADDRRPAFVAQLIAPRCVSTMGLRKAGFDCGDRFREAFLKIGLGLPTDGRHGDPMGARIDPDGVDPGLGLQKPNEGLNPLRLRGPSGFHRGRTVAQGAVHCKSNTQSSRPH